MPDETPAQPAPAPLIDAEQLSARFRDYGLNTLNPVLTMMMSGVFATAALAFADIVRTPDLRWMRLSIWLLLATMATVGIVRGTNVNLLFVHPRPVFVAYQLTNGFLASMGFACLPLSTGGPDGWFYALITGILYLLVSFYVVVRVRFWLAAEYYDQAVRPFVEERVRYHARGAWALGAQIGILSVLTAAAWITRGGSAAWNAAMIMYNFSGAALAIVYVQMDLLNYQNLIAAIERLRRERLQVSGG